MNEKPAQKPNGFALPELLIAMVLFAVGALALAQMTGLGIKVNVQTIDDTQVVTLAQWQLETLVGLGYQNLTPGGDLNSNATVSGVPYFETYSEPGSGVVYTKRWKISPCAHDDTSIPCSPGENYVQTPWYEISVRVFADRKEKIASTRAREVTVRARIIQPF